MNSPSSLTPICSYCGQSAALATGKTIYPHRPDLAALHFWSCQPCGAYVGCHAAGDFIEKEDGSRIVSDGTLPKGTLADSDLRRERRKVHELFDPLWKGARDKAKARKEAYAWLAGKLGIHIDQCHVGLFDLAQCQRAMAACERRGSLRRRA